MVLNILCMTYFAASIILHSCDMGRMMSVLPRASIFLNKPQISLINHPLDGKSCNTLFHL